MILLENTEKQVINFPKTQNINGLEEIEVVLKSEIDNVDLNYGFLPVEGYYTDFYPIEVDLKSLEIKAQQEYKYFLRRNGGEYPIETGLLKIINNLSTSTPYPAKYEVKARYTQYEF